LKTNGAIIWKFWQNVSAVI